MNLIGNINAIPFRRFRGGGGVAPFPSIPGMIARYSALGLTNEQMAENPVWKDLTGNGHDLQMKNFAWSGMSGVGGYAVDIDEWGTNSTAAYYERNSIKITATFKENASLGLLYHNIKLRQSCVLKVTGIPEGCDAFLDDRLGNRFYMSEDGVYEIIPSNFLAEALYLSIEKYPERWYRSKLTIEQLPLYPGALVFDGVDDYGTCDNFPVLTKEKGYTVVALRQWITYNPNAVSAIATNASDQSFNGAFTFENYNKGAEQTISYGATQISLQYSKSPFSWQTTSKYNGVNIANGNKDATNSLVLGRSYPQRNNFANFAIWELVFLDHDATEEELTKIKDYFVKTYPWLFPDQAWTVTGKTNEDKDRTTIANITGNGNDLVLSNFGFAEGSGYGLYKQNFTKIQWTSPSSRVEVTKTNSSFNITNVKNITIQVYYLSKINEVAFTVPSIKVRVTGLTDGQTINYRYFVNGAINGFLIPSDGIYNLPEFEFPAKGDYYGFNLTKVQSSCNITIEQIPEYEGYLVTDGVDDKIESKQPFQLPIKFSMIGSWVFIKKEDKRAGISKENNLIVYDKITGLTLFLNSVESYEEIDIDSFHAISSDGKLYDENWNMLPITVGSLLSDSSTLKIAYDGNNFVQFAFNCMGFYDKILKKDDLLKGWIYLKGLKAQRIPPSKNYILKEDGGYVLQEDGNKILTEQQ